MGSWCGAATIDAMTAPSTDASWRRRTTDGLFRILALADDPLDEDDLRRRKRVGVVAGYLTIVAPLTLPIQARGHPLSWVFALGLSAFSLINLLRLSQTRDPRAIDFLQEVLTK